MNELWPHFARISFLLRQILLSAFHWRPALLREETASARSPGISIHNWPLPSARRCCLLNLTGLLATSKALAENKLEDLIVIPTRWRRDALNQELLQHNQITEE